MIVTWDTIVWLDRPKTWFLFTSWLKSEHVLSVIDSKVLEWSVVGPDFILVECQIWTIIITFLSCSDPTTNIGWKYSLHNHWGIKSYIIWNLFLNIRKKSFSNFILHNIQYDSHRKTTTVLSDLIRHEKTLVINQSHIKYGSLCFYTILIFLFISEQLYNFRITTVNDATTDRESSQSNQITCRAKAGCKLIIVLHHFDKKNTNLYVMKRQHIYFVCCACVGLAKILHDSIITVCQVFWMTTT